MVFDMYENAKMWFLGAAYAVGMCLAYLGFILGVMLILTVFFGAFSRTIMELVI